MRERVVLNKERVAINKERVAIDKGRVTIKGSSGDRQATPSLGSTDFNIRMLCVHF